jgi:tRNA(Ile2) C34 agmatinyltransferase TiaS
MPLFRRERSLTNYRMPEDRNPICPFCEKDIDGLMSRSIKADAGRGYVWTCPRCLKVLGVSHRSGYILG